MSEFESESKVGKSVGSAKHIKITHIIQPRPKARPIDSEVEITVGPDGLEEIIHDRKLALSRMHGTIDNLVKDLNEFFPQVPEIMPKLLQGQLLNPDASPSKLVSVTAERPVYTPEENVSDFTWPTPEALTDNSGFFTLTLPNVQVPKNGLALVIRGSNATSEIAVRRVDLVGVEGGKLGIVVLDKMITPLPRSIVSQLVDIVPKNPDQVEESPEEYAEPQPGIRFGEGDCARAFHSNSGVIDRYGYSVLVRLIEPS